MRSFRLIPAILLVATATTSVAQQQQGRDVTLQKLDSIANSPVLENRVAGLVAAVVKGNDTLLMKGYGKADVEWGIPMPADAMLELGSVMKQFTAVAILQLRDEGKLSLDDEITKYLPDFPTRGHKVTLRRLLDHTSGIRGITEIREFGILVESTRFPRDSAYALIKRQEFQFAPGEAMVYNNSAFWLLGLVIEKQSGMTYEDYIEKRIFAPLNMTRSMYCNSTENVPRRAHGYLVQNGNVRRAPSNVHTWPYSAGSLCSTAGDMVTWLKALHGGKVLSAASYAELITPSKLNDGVPLRYSMGLDVLTDFRGLRTIGHGGAISGFVADVTWYPDAQMAVVVLINSNGNVNPGALGGELAAAVLPSTRPAPKTFAGDPEALVGRYIGPSRGRDMVVVVTGTPDGGITYSSNGSPARQLTWVDGLTFRQGNTLLTFRRASPNGPVSALHFDAVSGLYVLKKQ